MHPTETTTRFEARGTVLALLARRAGLDLALKEHPQDVQAAADHAAAVLAQLHQCADPGTEPWPPMRVEPAR